MTGGEEKATERKGVFSRIVAKLASLGFRTGCILLAAAIVCYLISFGQMAIPGLSAWMKGILWTVFFGLAKTFQYTSLLILGKEGIQRVKRPLQRLRNRSARIG